MTARDEMKRLNPSTTPFKTLADIIENCMLEKPAVSVYDMALGDYEFLLHRLRVVTYNDTYKMSVTCPYCLSTFDSEMHLDQLELHEFDLDKFENLRTFNLPKSGKLITIKFQTPRILDEIALKTKEMQRKFKNADLDFTTMVTLLTGIEAVDGEHLDDIKLEAFIDKLPAMDMSKILQNISALNKSLGINNDFSLDCPKCGNEIQTFFRFGPEFLDPQTSKDGQPYGPKQFKSLVQECWFLSDQLHTSYVDLLDISVAERRLLLQYVTRKIEDTQKEIERATNTQNEV